MTRVNYETLGKFVDIDEKDLEFERVTNSIDVVEREYGVEVIFDYYRRHGFPHYTIREEEKHEHMRKLKKFDVDTIFIDNQIVQTMHCLRLAWSYFPQSVGIGNRNITRVKIQTEKETSSTKIDYDNL